MPDRSAKIKKTSSTDYTKLAKAIGDIRDAGINVSLIDINKSDFGFKPDANTNTILFGMKGLLNVSDDIVKSIIANRPYESPRDFINKINPNRQAMVALIKGGAFDSMMDRKACMTWYIWETCDKKSRLTLQNMASLIKYDLLPEETEQEKTARQIYEFNKFLKSYCKLGADKYKLNNSCIDFLTAINQEHLINDDMTMGAKSWDKVYQVWMNVYRDWIAANKEDILQSLNEKIFYEDWQKYAKGTISAWEMEVLCFYYHEHELANIDYLTYGLSDFNKLNTEPIVDKVFGRGGKDINIYKLYKICGTCIAKNKLKSIVTLLTPSGVVDVKLRKEHFSFFDKQISERDETGTKHVKEKSWFNRGSMIIVMGIRQGDTFVAKKYNSSLEHQLYKITSIDRQGQLTLQSERYKGAEDV